VGPGLTAPGLVSFSIESQPLLMGLG